MKIKLIAGLVLAAGTMLAGPRIAIGVGVGGPAYYGPAYYPAPVYSYYAPPPVYAVAPPIPGPGYVWVGGSWFVDRGYRTWRPGYWAPPRHYVAPRFNGGYYRGGRFRR